MCELLRFTFQICKLNVMSFQYSFIIQKHAGREKSHFRNIHIIIMVSVSNFSIVTKSDNGYSRIPKEKNILR